MDFKIRNEVDRESVKAYLDALSFSNEYTVTISKTPKKRSTSQNRLYHMWLNCISNETGNDVETLHRYFAAKFLGVDIEVVFGKKVARVRSTTKLTTEDFSIFLEKIQAEVLTELGIQLPQPSDLYYTAFLDKYDSL